MSDEKVLTKEIAEQFLADEDSVDLSEFTAIEDDAAEVIAKHEHELCLNGINSLSDKAATLLSQSRGPLSIDLEELHEQARVILRAHPSLKINQCDLETWLLENLDFDWDNEGEAWVAEPIYDALLEAADKYTCRDTNSEHEWLNVDSYTPFSEGIELIQQAGSRDIHLCSLQDNASTILVFFGEISQVQERITPLINSHKQ